MKTTRIVLSAFIALLGLVHICFTAQMYPGWHIDAFWFAGTGLALIFMGLFNALLIGRTECWTRLCGAVANFAGLALLLFVALNLGVAQGWLSVILAAGLFATSIVDGHACSCGCGKCECEKPTE
jgi:hypothetical protein